MWLCHTKECNNFFTGTLNHKHARSRVLVCHNWLIIFDVTKTLNYSL